MKRKPAGARKSFPGFDGGIPRPTVIPGILGELASPDTGLAKTRPHSLEPVRHARSLNGRPIRLVEDFISEKERALLCRFAEAPDAPWETDLPQGNVWHGRMINPRSMTPRILKSMESIRKRIVSHIRTDYAIEDPIYADTLQLVRWRPGDRQSAHADCEEPDGRPNRTPWRAFASIIYLNDEYEGGGIYFPKRGLRPDIKPRTLAYFPSTREYLHGVEEISAGRRFTMSCFYTFDKRRHDGHAV